MRVSGNRRPRGGGRSGSGNGRSGSSGGRNGSNNNRRSNNGNRSYDSNGPDGKIRGSASQVYDKYTTLAQDAQTAGDPVSAENYYQHAEHYFRIMLANNMVKTERATEQPVVEDSQPVETSDTDDSARGNSTDSPEETSSSDSSEGSSQENISVEKQSDTTREDVATNGVSETADEPELQLTSDDETEKPKTKRRVSRTRGLRRRANRRDEGSSEADEPQTAE